MLVTSTNQTAAGAGTGQKQVELKGAFFQRPVPGRMDHMIPGHGGGILQPKKDMNKERDKNLA